MAASTLRPQGYLRDPSGHQATFEPCTFRPQRNFNPNSSRSRRRKRSPGADKFPGKDLVMGEVKILKRGETLSGVSKKAEHVAGSGGKKLIRGNKGGVDLALGSTVRLGPEPETVQKQVSIAKSKVADVIYAGSAFVVSPPPSSLPVPGFLGRSVRS